jgi:O-acetyl-ADP-ribose deacetylase (regulator of RNase III)
VLENLDTTIATLGILTAIVALILTTGMAYRWRVVPRSPTADVRTSSESSVEADRRGPVPETQIWIAPVHASGGTARYVGIITGDMKRVSTVDIWVNPENTKMEMARIEEDSTSGIIRFLGSERDSGGRVVADTIADALNETVGDLAPVAPGSAFATTSGSLRESHNVHHVIHVAAVQGEPAAGYRQVRDVGQCVTNGLVLAASLTEADRPAGSILFPLLGTGVGRGPLLSTVYTLVGTAVNYLELNPATGVHTVYFLAYTYQEYDALHDVIDKTDKLGPLRRWRPGEPQ